MSNKRGVGDFVNQKISTWFKNESKVIDCLSEDKGCEREEKGEKN